MHEIPSDGPPDLGKGKPPLKPEEPKAGMTAVVPMSDDVPRLTFRQRLRRWWEVVKRRFSGKLDWPGQNYPTRPAGKRPFGSYGPPQPIDPNAGQKSIAGIIGGDAGGTAFKTGEAAASSTGANAPARAASTLQSGGVYPPGEAPQIIKRRTRPAVVNHDWKPRMRPFKPGEHKFEVALGRGVGARRLAVPQVILAEIAYDKMVHFVERGEEEVGWLGVVTALSGGRYLIRDCWLLTQNVHGTTTLITVNGLAQFQEEHRGTPEADDIWENTSFWGHSHVNMGVFASSQDNHQMEVFRDCGQPVFIRGIFNKRGEAVFDVFDYEHGITWHDVPWTKLDDVDPDLLDQIDREFQEKVTSVSGFGGWKWGEGGRKPYSVRPQGAPAQAGVVAAPSTPPAPAEIRSAGSAAEVADANAPAAAVPTTAAVEGSPTVVSPNPEAAPAAGSEDKNDAAG